MKFRKNKKEEKTVIDYSQDGADDGTREPHIVGDPEIIGSKQAQKWIAFGEALKLAVKMIFEEDDDLGIMMVGTWGPEGEMLSSINVMNMDPCHAANAANWLSTQINIGHHNFHALQEATADVDQLVELCTDAEPKPEAGA